MSDMASMAEFLEAEVLALKGELRRAAQTHVDGGEGLARQMLARAKERYEAAQRRTTAGVFAKAWEQVLEEARAAAAATKEGA